LQRQSGAFATCFASGIGSITLPPSMTGFRSASESFEAFGGESKHVAIGEAEELFCAGDGVVSPGWI